MSRRGVFVSASSLLVVLGCAVACQSNSESDSRGGPKTLASTNVAPELPAIEQEAVEILRGAAAHIRNSQSMTVAGVTGFDVLQDSGEMIEFGSTWSAAIQRPDRARLESQRRDGVRTQIVMDGNDLWMYSPDHEVWGTEPQVGDVNASFQYLLDELGVSTPLANLFSDDLGASLDDGLESCYLVGDSTIRGRVCHHIAARNDYVDYQIWIDEGEVPVLRRLVIDYREEKGRPRYWAYFTEWTFDTKASPNTFLFQPPAGAEQIRLAHANEGAE